jgi:hypothetical protein
MRRDFLQSIADPLTLYSFQFRDRISGKRVRAPHVAERHEIAARYVQWAVIRPPERPRLLGAAFSPWK